jgi:hypothetical protein
MTKCRRKNKLMNLTNKKPLVELRVAKIPGVVGWVAVHYWFVIHIEGQAERWEVWQLPSQNETSWFHIHKNLLPFAQGVGNGDSWVETQWQGEQAQKLSDILKSSPQQYPNLNNYHYWPGPNSNTYVQWTLNQAGLAHQLIPQGIGKNHMGWCGWGKLAGVSQFSTPLLGVKYQKSTLFEVHILHLALSVRFKPLKIRTCFYYEQH